MNSLFAFRDAVVASLQAKMPGVNIDSHGGSFDLEEIKRFATLAPAVRVALVGASGASRYSDGRWKVPVECAAVIVTRDSVVGSQKVARDAAALTLASAVELALAANRFGLEGVFQPAQVRAKNEYSGPVDTTGVALWQVVWTSEVLLGSAGDPSDVVIAALIEGIVNGTPIYQDGALTEADPLNHADNPGGAP